MQVSIIIVNYNVKHFLEQCLHSVQAATRQLQAEVIVVDNNSTDGSVAYLQPIFPWVKWIANKQNTGFGVANNQAVAIATGDTILFLNPDTLLPEDCLEKCLQFLAKQPTAGALGIKMIDGSGQYLPESKRGFPSPLTSLFKLSGLTALFPKSKLFSKYYMGHLSTTENNPVDVLAGAFMLVRTTVLQQTGGFDERFFMYGEDIDLSFRIQKKGWQNWYFADSCIIHFKGESTKKGSLDYVRMFYQAMSIFVKKHYGGSKAFLYRWIIQIAIWCRALISLIVSSIRKLFSTHFLKKKDTVQPQKIQVIATENDFVFVKNSLHSINDTNITHNASLKSIDVELKNAANTETIFCISNELSMQSIITTMQQNSGCWYAFHYTGSQSIIGSQSKNNSGQIITVIPQIK